MTQQELEQLVLRQINVIAGLTNRIVDLDSRISKLDTYLTEANRLSKWISFRSSLDYSRIVETLIDLGFTKKNIEKTITIAYDPNITIQQMIDRVRLQLSTRNIFQE